LPVVGLPEYWIHHEQLIAEGKTGEVWKVIIHQGVFAMKKFKLWEHLRAEADIVEVLSHPHIVHTFGSTGLEDRNAGIDQLSLLMECMEHDLSGWITSQETMASNQKPTPLDLLDVLLQVSVDRNSIFSAPNLRMCNNRKIPPF
jgi:serine/threonine protein kinase